MGDVTRMPGTDGMPVPDLREPAQPEGTLPADHYRQAVDSAMRDMEHQAELGRRMQPVIDRATATRQRALAVRAEATHRNLVWAARWGALGVLVGGGAWLASRRRQRASGAPQGGPTGAPS